MASAAAVVYTLLLFRTFVVKFLVGCETPSQRKLSHICPKTDSCRSALKKLLALCFVPQMDSQVDRQAYAASQAC